jgi:two-component system LytT family response regulator
MTTVLILEDCKESIAALATIMKEYREDIHVLFAHSFREAILHLEEAPQIDIFLLDINLDSYHPEDQSGLTFARKVREVSKYAFTPIVFITSMTGLELISYRETQCYTYLTKPYEKETVIHVLEKVIKYSQPPESRQLIVKKGGVNYRIKVEDILCIEAIPRGIRLYLQDESLDLKYISIKNILVKLPEEQFIQCHRMYVVNVNAIDYVDTVNRMIHVNGVKQRIEIGVTYKTEMRRLLREEHN